MGYISDTAVGYLTDSTNLGVFLRLATSPALHLTLGVNDMPIGIDSIDPGGTVYRGAGVLQNIPELEMLINGISDSVRFTVSGVDATFAATLDEAAPPVLGAQIHVGFAPLDANYQPRTDIIPIWLGWADYWSAKQTESVDHREPAISSITLVARSGTHARSKQNLSTYTDQAQKLVNPISGQDDDKFCERVARYFQGYIVSWPRY